MDYTTVPGIFMHEGERKLIVDLSSLVSSQFSPCNIVHIGIGWGGSLYCSRIGAPDARIYGVDIMGDDDIKGDASMQIELNLVVLRGDSRSIEFFKPIHFLYVDGDHHYDVVKSDILRWGSKVVPGGYIAFHDCIGDWAKDVNRAIDECLSAKEWEDCGIASWSRYFRRSNGRD